MTRKDKEYQRQQDLGRRCKRARRMTQEGRRWARRIRGMKSLTEEYSGGVRINGE